MKRTRAAQEAALWAQLKETVRQLDSQWRSAVTAEVGKAESLDAMLGQLSAALRAEGASQQRVADDQRRSVAALQVTPSVRLRRGVDCVDRGECRMDASCGFCTLQLR